MQWYEYSKTEVCGVKPVPVPLSSPQIPQGLAWDWNHAHAARWQQLPATVIAPLLCSMTDWNVEWHLLVNEAATQQCNKSDVLTATNAEWKKNITKWSPELNSFFRMLTFRSVKWTHGEITTVQQHANVCDLYWSPILIAMFQRFLTRFSERGQDHHLASLTLSSTEPCLSLSTSGCFHAWWNENLLQSSSIRSTNFYWLKINFHVSMPF
jgi:hypothetical protein